MAHALGDPAQTQDGRADLLTVIQELASSSDEALASLSEMLAATAEIAKFSRSLRAALNQIRKGLQGVLDGRAVIEDWGRRAEAIERADFRDSDDENSQDTE